LAKIMDFVEDAGPEKYDENGFITPDYERSYKEDPDWVQGFATYIDNKMQFVPVLKEEAGKLVWTDPDEMEYPAPPDGAAFMAALESYHNETAVAFECSPQEAEWIAMGLSCLYEHMPNKITAHSGPILYLRRQIREILAELYIKKMRQNK